MSDEYSTVLGIASAKHVVKKSRFFADATEVACQQAVRTFLNDVRAQRPRASHYCYAYSIGSGTSKREYATDAGEPRNSAGPPILSVIQAQGISNAVCVVTRYFGGIHLGIGGLIRAYGQCARTCLQNATLAPRIFYQHFRCKVPYSYIGTVVTLCKRSGGDVTGMEWTPQPIIAIRIRQGAVEAFKARLQGIGILTL